MTDGPSLLSPAETLLKEMRANHFVAGVLTPCTLGQLLADADRWAIRSDSGAAMIGLLQTAIRDLLDVHSRLTREITRITQEKEAQGTRMDRER